MPRSGNCRPRSTLPSPFFNIEEMSVAEVAVALGVPAGTVKTRLMHARQKLRDVLQGE